MAITLQGDPYNLQGNNQNIQGSAVATVLQPAGSPTPAAPIAPLGPPAVPAPAPRPAVAPKPVVRPVAPAPSLRDLSGDYGLSGSTVYRKRDNYAFTNAPEFLKEIGATNFSGLKFDTSYNPSVAQTPSNSMPLGLPTSMPAGPSIPADPNQALGETAGKAGLSFDDYMKVLAGQNGLSDAEQKAIKDSLGIGALEGSVFAQPSKTTEQLYTDAYNSAGLGDLKQKISDLDAKIADIKAKYTDKAGTINENPFLSEATRVGRLGRLTDQQNAEIGNLEDEYKQYADLYNQGLTEVNNLVTRQTNDFTDNQQLNAQKLAYLTSKANEMISQKTSEKVGQAYGTALPAYLATLAKSKAPQTIGSADTGFFQYDPTSGKFIQITAAQPKIPASAQEYEYYAAQEKAAGRTPVSYNEYQNMDANRKAAVARAGAAVYANGLSNQELTQVQKLTGQFDGEPIVKNYNVIAEGYNFAKSLSNNTQNPSDDQGLIYAFAKAMDPNSVVREGEYATVQRYAQTWADQFGFTAKRIFENSPFLTPQARANMKATIEAKFKAAQNQYNNVYTEYGRRVDQITGQGGGTDFLTNYAQSNQPAQGGTSADLSDLFN